MMIVINPVRFFFLLELLKLTVLVAMATCTDGTCQTSYCEQPVSKIDIPVNWGVEWKLPAPISKIGYLCINYIVGDMGD